MADTSYDGFFGDLVRCETRLYNALDELLRDRHGIGTGQFELLRHLRDNPGSRVADAAAAFAVGIGAISKGVDRLARRGWVTRRPNPADRRSSLLVLTAKGARLVDTAERTFTAGLADLVGDTLSASALANTARALARLRAALERDGVGLPTG